MNTKPKTWHFFIALSITLLIFRFPFIFDLLSLLFSYTFLLLTDFSNAARQTNVELLDNLSSDILVIALPLLIFFRFRKYRISQADLDFASSTITVLVFIFIFAPLISSSHPDFQKNIGLTKLLPPLSSKKYLKFEATSLGDLSRFEKFVYQKNHILKLPFDESLVFVDSVRFTPQISYYQNGRLFETSNDSLVIYESRYKTGTRYFLLGTDEFGRDIFSRLIYGARVSIFVGICSMVVSFLIGLLLGCTAGSFGGIVDLILNRLTDTFLAFPAIFLVIIILGLFGNSMFAVITVLGFSGWMSLFKIVRGEVVSLKQKDFFISAKMIGLSSKQLLIREVLPVILTPVIVNLVFQFGNVILAEAALSYLGLGTGSNYPSWGSMIDAGQNYLKNAWWMIFFPGVALIFTLYSANDLGQKIKVYFNPQLKK